MALDVGILHENSSFIHLPSSTLQPNVDPKETLCSSISSPISENDFLGYLFFLPYRFVRGFEHFFMGRNLAVETKSPKFPLLQAWIGEAVDSFSLITKKRS